MKKLLLTLAVLIFVSIAPAAHATTYYLSPAGSDLNPGTAGSPWFTPNHSISCGDQIIAAPGNYPESSFYAGEWGAVSGSGHCVAWLTCATFDACTINSTNGYGMFVTASHWGVMGWEVSALAGQAICFQAFPRSSSASLQDIIFANDIADGCYGAAFEPVTNGSAGADYFVLIADIAYNGAQESSVCASGIDIYGPIQTDSQPGTHMFISQTFSWANVEPNPCAGHNPTDGNGVIFDTWDLNGYAAQGAIENNISFFNGASGYRVDLTTQAPVSIVNNTSYGNNSGPGLNASWCGEIITQSSANVTAEKNIAMTDAVDGCGSWPIYAYYLAAWTATNTFNYNLGYSPGGTNDGSNDPGNFVFGPNNIFGTNPAFVSAPANVPPAPNCAGAASVIACMAPIIADFTPASSSASGLGYQPVSNVSNNDPLFPSWLCPYSNILSGLITMGCGASVSLPPGGGFTPIRVNAGGPAYVDSLGQSWSADAGFTGGSAYSTPAAIGSTNDLTLYQTERFGSFSYSFAVPAGSYAVTLKFAEIFWSSPGQRIFNVVINGATVLSNFDIVAQAGGPDLALDKTFTVSASTGNITIQFIVGTADLPKVSAIQIAAGSSSGVSIQMSPTSASLDASQTQQFSATVTGSSNTAVTWSMNPQLGTLGQTGLYTAPGVVSSQQAVTVVATAAADMSQQAIAMVTLTPAVGGDFAPIRVNGGGPAYIDSLGQLWGADADFAGGGTYNTPVAVGNTSDSTLYQSERFGSLSYSFAVPAGTYAVTLKFAEIYWTSPGQRIFNVVINGATVLSNFDILAQAGGPDLALDKTFTISANTGTIAIQFIAGSADLPKVSAIQIAAQ